MELYLLQYDGTLKLVESVLADMLDKVQSCRRYLTLLLYTCEKDTNYSVESGLFTMHVALLCTASSSLSVVLGELYQK